MLHVLINEGLVDQSYIEAHTSGFGALSEIVKNYSPEAVAEICGLAVADIVQAATLVWSQQGSAVDVLPGAEPVGAWHPQQRRDHSPAFGDRADRQAGRRPVLA
jgi:anaerobic selenocysteine-containing dehydrogenase